MMSQGSSCSGSKGRKKWRGVLTTADIAECNVRPFLPMVGCPDCEDHQKVFMRISESIANPGAYYVKCERQGQSQKCNFYRWLHQYALHLQEIGEPDPYNILPRIEELHRNKLASEGEVNQEPMMNRGHIALEGQLRENLLEDLSFEARSSKDSAWYVVAIFLAHRKRSSGEVEVRVRFKGFGAEEDEWINVRKSIRQESIPLESSECGTIAKGDLVLCFKESNDYALHFDAHVLDIQRKHHCIRECRCVFHVKYLHDQSQEMVNLKRLSRRPRNL